METIKAAISMAQTTSALCCEFDEQNLYLTHLCGVVTLTYLKAWEFTKHARALKLRETRPRENSLKK